MRILIAILAVTIAAAAHAQSYPTRPVHFVVPFPVSGATDILARVIGQKLQEALGQPVPIDNKPAPAARSARRASRRRRPTATPS
jgi:tripartite-type tricarboxylate transporter receptor subunit TctC